MFTFTSPFSPVTHSAIYRGSIQHAHKACGGYWFCDQLVCRNRSTWSEIINTDCTQHTQVTPHLCCLCLQKSRAACLRFGIALLCLLSPFALLWRVTQHDLMDFLHLLFSHCQCHILRLQFWKAFMSLKLSRSNGDHWTLMCLSAQRAPLFHQSLISLKIYFYKWVPTSVCGCKGSNTVWEITAPQAPAWLPHHLFALSGSDPVRLRQVWKRCPLFFLTKSTAKVQQSLTSSGSRG